MHKSLIGFLICIAFYSLNAFGKKIYAEIPQSCKNIQWSVNSTESESSYLISSAIYQTLVRLGPSGKIQPNLAESWKINSPIQIHFKLKDGLLFSNGEAVEAQDVKLSLEEISKTTAFTKIILAGIKDVDVIDKKTFAINLIKPDALIFQKMSVFFRIYFLRKAKLENKSVEEIAPGTGPWKIKAIGTDRYTFNSSKKNDDSELNIFCNQHGNSSDGIHHNKKKGLVLIEGLSYKDQLTMRRKFKLATIETSDSVQSFGIFNLLSDNKAVRSLEIRKAINYALDRNAFSRLVLKDQGHMLPGLSLINEVGHKDLQLYPYKKNEAANIIHKWKKANKQESITLRVGLQSDEDTTISFIEQLKHSLDLVGINLTINRKYSVDRQPEFVKDIDLIFGSDPSPYQHLDFLVRNFYIPTSMFFVGITKELESKITHIDALETGEDSQTLYTDIDQYLYENYMGVPGFQPQKIRAYSGNIMDISSQGPLLDFSIITDGGL